MLVTGNSTRAVLLEWLNKGQNEMGLLGSGSWRDIRKRSEERRSINSTVKEKWRYIRGNGGKPGVSFLAIE